MPARLPDLVVLGAPKAGTTSLAGWLAAHPQVAMSATKELEFLDRYWDRGLDWYRSSLPDAPPGVLVGEATPTYLGDPSAPERAAAALPGTRFVAVLREPVARAWSNYWFFCQLGLERRSWAAALEAEQRGSTPQGYLSRGRYAEQLARWDAAVGADRLLVLLFDDLVADPAALFARVCRWLGVDDALPPVHPGAVNPTSRPRSRRLQAALLSSGASRTSVGRRAWQWNGQGGRPPALPPDEARRLRAGFAEDTAALAARLGRALPPSWAPGAC